MANANRAYLTKKQLGEYLGGLSDDAIDRYVRVGALPPSRKLGPGPNGRRLWIREEVDDRIDELPPANLQAAS